MKKSTQVVLGSVMTALLTSGAAFVSSARADDHEAAPAAGDAATAAPVKAKSKKKAKKHACGGKEGCEGKTKKDKAACGGKEGCGAKPEGEAKAE